MKRLITSIALTATLLSVGAVTAHAQYYTPPQESSQIAINKLVRNPQSGVMVDNLGLNDPRYTSLQEVIFQIQVKNTGSQNLTNLTVKDQLPSHVDFVAGPGSFDASSNTLTFNVDSLNINETKTFEVRVKVRSADKVPANQVTCVPNVAIVTKDSMTAQDTAQFCFENNVPSQPKGGPVLPGVTTLPKTGVADVLATLALTLGSALAGIYVWAKKSFN